MVIIESRLYKPGVWVISIEGRLTIGSDGQRAETLAAQLFAGGARVVIFDLARVTHLDSTGIGYLVAAMNHAMEAGATLLMAAATPKTREAFRLTRLDSVFSFFDSVDAAAAAAASASQ